VFEKKKKGTGAVFSAKYKPQHGSNPAKGLEKELSQNSSVSTARRTGTVIYLEYSRATDAIVTLDVFELHRNVQRYARIRAYTHE